MADPQPLDFAKALAGNVCIVTGAASGFGAALCTALDQYGAHLVLVDIDTTAGRALCDRLNESRPNAHIFVEADVSIAANFKRVFHTAADTYGRIDVLVNNAGIAESPVRLHDDTKLAFRRVLAVNLDAVVTGTHLALHYWSSVGRGGVVVNISSMGGLFPIPLAPVYAATKHGVIGLSTSLVGPGALPRDDIRVTCVAPSYVDTPLVRNAAQKSPGFAKMLEKTRLAKVDDVVRAILTCIADETLRGAVLTVTAHGVAKLPLRTGKL